MSEAADELVIEGLVIRGRRAARAAAAPRVHVVTDTGARWRVVGEVDELRSGAPVRVHARRQPGGRGLRALDYQLVTPAGAAAIERFLASGYLDGVGPAIARRLVAAFGDDTLRVLDCSPARLAEVDGVGAVRASRIAAAYAEHRHVQDVAAMLRGHGVPTAFAIRMIRRHGGDVMWLPTPPSLVEAMLDLARVTATDHVIDLGAGDGALVLAAARRGARATGVESNPELVAAARAAAAAAGLDHLASFREGDLFTADLSAATVITLFLLPSVNAALRPRLRALAPGTRIVSNTWGMGDWPPDATVTLDDAALPWRTALLWTVPPSIGG